MAEGTVAPPGTSAARGPRGPGRAGTAILAFASVGLLVLGVAGTRLRSTPRTLPPPTGAGPGPWTDVPGPRRLRDLAVRDDGDRPVPEAIVHVVTAAGRAYVPPAIGTTDARGVVRLRLPERASGHRVEIQPQVLWTPADGASQVLPPGGVGAWLARAPEGGVRGWYPATIAVDGASWPTLRVRSWVRANVTVRSQLYADRGPAVPAPGVEVAVRLGYDDPDRFLRVATTDVEGHASFWLWSTEPVAVLALANGTDLESEEVLLSPDRPAAEMTLRTDARFADEALRGLELEAARARDALRRARGDGGR